MTPANFAASSVIFSTLFPSAVKILFENQ